MKRTDTYDRLQRLIGVNKRPSSVYTYDLAGNRTSVQVNGGTPTTTTYNFANQITNTGYSYDNAGNLINDGSAAYTYDALSRMTQRRSTTYTYNGDGTLVSQATGGVTTRYTQDLAAPLSQVLQTKVGSAAITDYRSRSFGARRPRTPDQRGTHAGSPGTPPAHKSVPRITRLGHACVVCMQL